MINYLWRSKISKILKYNEVGCIFDFHRGDNLHPIVQRFGQIRRQVSDLEKILPDIEVEVVHEKTLSENLPKLLPKTRLQGQECACL